MKVDNPSKASHLTQMSITKKDDPFSKEGEPQRKVNNKRLHLVGRNWLQWNILCSYKTFLHFVLCYFYLHNLI